MELKKKTCSKCLEDKLLTEYYKHKRYPGGYRYECKSCAKDEDKRRYQRHKSEGKVFIKNKKDSSRIWSLRNKFGITVEQYEELLDKQGRCCAICGKHESGEKRRFAVDHAHTSSNFVPEGMIRGLLCWPCNTFIIGKITDPEILLKASLYLRQHTGWKVPEDKIKPKRRRRKRKRKVT